MRPDWLHDQIGCGLILLLKRSLLSLFTLAFAACFGAVLLLSLLYSLLIKSRNNVIPISLTLLLFSAIAVLFFIAAYRIFSRLTGAGRRKVTIGLAAVIVLIELALIFFFHTIVPPVMDGGHTYGEALYLLAHGHASGDNYFKVYPNNTPITVLRYWLYRLFSMGHGSNYMVIDQAFCAAVLNVSIFFSWKLVVRLFDAKMGSFFLLLTLTCFPLFFYILYFYTDTVALMFPALLLYLWHCYHQSAKIRYILLLGLLLGIGDQIRPNLVLFLPALVIYMSFVLKWKKVLLNLTIIAVMMLGVSFSVQAYERQLGYTGDPSMKMPATHWIMLGLSRSGGFDGADYALTRRQPAQQSKIQANLNKIKTRIIQKKAPGLIKLWGLKAVRTWGMGAHGYYYYTTVTTQHTTAYEYLFNHQKRLMLFIIQIFYVVHLFFLVLSAVNYFRSKTVSLNLLIQICLFGNFIFYVFLWEAEPRYSLLFTPFMLIGTVFGFAELMTAARSRQAVRLLQTGSGRTAKLLLPVGLLIGVVVCAFLNAPAYTRDQVAQKSYSVDQGYATGLQRAWVDAGHQIGQTFRADQPFSHVSLNVLGKKRQGTYNFSITEMKTGKALFSQDFSSDRATPKHDLTFSLNKEIMAHGAQERITIRQIKGAPGAKIAFSLNGFGYDRGDVYPNGYFTKNGIKLKNADLKFYVYGIQKKPYLSTRTYWLIFSVPILMLLACIYVSLLRGDNDIEKEPIGKTLRNGIQK